MKNAKKNLKVVAPVRDNVVSFCYVIGFINFEVPCVEPTIHLKRPTTVFPGDEVMEFGNVFEAKKFIREHVQPGTQIKVAA